MAVIFTVVFFLYSVSIQPVLYALELCTVITLLLGVCDYCMFYKKHATLQKHEQLQDVYMLDMPESHSIIERDYQSLVNKLIREKARLRDDKLRAMTELKDYYATWAHQIKTPISAITLMLQVLENSSGEVPVKDLRQEIFKVDFYVDAVMNYLRLEDMTSDFHFEKYRLEDIVNKAVKKFAPQFINKHIAIDIVQLAIEVYMDEKWLGFIIEQLLSNSVKYTPTGGCVKIYMKETFNINDRILVIEDNGIGISAEDLPRIMERGFTGYNGRLDKKSSGIGLYLCKKAADKLGITISFASETDKGTKVFIDMTQNHTQHE
jgi:signal transduction histidine kinase